jgi:hypothetical protein
MREVGKHPWSGVVSGLPPGVRLAREAGRVFGRLAWRRSVSLLASLLPRLSWSPPAPSLLALAHGGGLSLSGGRCPSLSRARTCQGERMRSLGDPAHVDTLTP